MSITCTNEEEGNPLECDYLVVGAGAASLAFVDTLLDELPDTKVIMIDRKKVPGGHWVDAYGFVRLHQPSRFYGIASEPLEGTPSNFAHRACKREILDYYEGFVDSKIASGNLEFYPECIYDFESGDEDPSDGEENDENVRIFRSLDGSESYRVNVNIKLVDGTKGECIIPHDSPLQFPVDEGVRVMTPNQIYDAFERGGDERASLLRNKYVVLGAGKTGIDSVVYLQRTMEIDPSNIAWVVSRDVWMYNANYKGRPQPQTWARCLVESNADEAALDLETQGMIVRLCPDFLPSRYRFPVIPHDELELARCVTNVIRRGRVTAIRKSGAFGVEVQFGGEHSPWEAFGSIDTCVFVHATSPGPFNGSDPDSIPLFPCPRAMTLHLLLTGPRTFSMSLMAKLEAARRRKTLDLVCLRDVVHGRGPSKAKQDATEDELLNAAIRPLSEAAPYRPIVNLAMALAILDRDPLAALEWMKQIRMSYLSVPGAKTSSCEDLHLLRSNGKSLGFSESQLSVLEVLGDKLRPLEGL